MRFIKKRFLILFYKSPQESVDFLQKNGCPPWKNTLKGCDYIKKYFLFYFTNHHKRALIFYKKMDVLPGTTPWREVILWEKYILFNLCVRQNFYTASVGGWGIFASTILINNTNANIVIFIITAYLLRCVFSLHTSTFNFTLSDTTHVNIHYKKRNAEMHLDTDDLRRCEARYSLKESIWIRRFFTLGTF